MLAYIIGIRTQNSQKLYVSVQGQPLLMGPYLSYLLKKLSVKGEKVGVVGSRCSSNSFTEYYVCNFLTLWHVYLKAYQYRFNIVSTRSLLTLYNGHAIGNPYRKEFAGKNRFMTIGLNAGRCE